MANKFWNIVKANQALDAAEQALAPHLEKAGIKSISIDGKSVSLSEAPLSSKISALVAAQPVVAESASAAEALVSNELISKKLEETETALAIKTTAVDGLTRDKAELADKLTKSEAAVADLTSKLSTCTIERDSAVNQYNAVSKLNTAQKSALVARCIAANCLDFTALSKDATEADKTASAEKLSFDDLFKAYNGAVNAAVAKTGVSFAAIPSISGAPATVTGSQKEELTGRARFNASVAKDFGKK